MEGKLGRVSAGGCWRKEVGAFDMGASMPLSRAFSPATHYLSMPPFLQLNIDMNTPWHLSKAEKIWLILSAVNFGLIFLVWCCFGCRDKISSIAPDLGRYRSDSRFAIATAAAAAPPAQVELPPATSSDVEKGLRASISAEA